MVDSCTKKCVMSSSQTFSEGELNKGESVCMDRCIAKYVQAMEKMSKLMQEKQESSGAAGGGGMFGS
jgi:import inner membrane translocase subunit TIM10